MKYRKLRIAWSVGCGIACVLLVVLWMRSYWWWEAVGIQLSSMRAIAAHSFKGKVMFLHNNKPTGDWGFHQRSIEATKKLSGWSFPESRGQFDFTTDANSMNVFIPWWARSAAASHANRTPLAPLAISASALC